MFIITPVDENLAANLLVPYAIGGSLLLCALTWLITTIRFQLAVAKLEQSAKSSPTPEPSPVLPYAIPWLGSAFAFLSDKPGSFWTSFQGKLAAVNIDVCGLVLGGVKHHVTSGAAVQRLFTNRQLAREIFSKRVLVKAIGMPVKDTEKAFPLDAHGRVHAPLKSIYPDFLLNQKAVNTLADKFIENLNQRLVCDDGVQDGKVVELFAWFKEKMFMASTAALFGTKIIEMNPNSSSQYWDFEAGLLTRLLGMPRILKPKPYQALDDLLRETERWLKYVEEEDPSGEPEWEPISGAKLIRARHDIFKQMGISRRARASFNCVFMLGASSNTIPATGWMLTHLFSSTTAPDVLPRIAAEVQSSRRADGSIDTSALLVQPLLNSALNETLRLYVDVFIVHGTAADLMFEGHAVKKTDIVVAPTYLGHHDGRFWDRQGLPGHNEWHAERFLKRDEKSGKDVCSTSGTTGKYLPFGGGSEMCPGRVFARHEILGAVATLLLNFEVEFQKFTDGSFPHLKRQQSGRGGFIMEGDLQVKLRRKAA